MQLKEFKEEIGQILDRYQVPMDDRSFILEKIEGQFGSFADVLIKKINAEREKDSALMAEYEKRANETIKNTLLKAQDSVKKAYALGQAAATTAKPGYSWFHIIVTGSLLVLGGFIIFREFFSKKDEE